MARYGSPFRVPLEFYTTPPSATLAFLEAERFEGSIWEPACGDGAISRCLIEHGYDTVSTDLAERGFGQGGRDFLNERHPLARNIVTNPPYGGGHADAFVRHALEMLRQTGGRAAFLLNLASLCNPKRHERWLRRPPARIYLLDECHCRPNGDPDRAKRWAESPHAARYCWAVWEAVQVDRTEVLWLTTKPFAHRDEETWAPGSKAA